MKCLIIAAGMGSRLAGRTGSKPLLEVGGRPLIERVILAARQAGVSEHVVVTGHAAEAVEDHLRGFSRKEGIEIAFVRNDEWRKENGLSVYKARELAGDRFILSMSDHIFDPAIFGDLARLPLSDDATVLAVDSSIEGNAYVDMDDVTRVLVEGGKIRAIGKSLPEYNAFDTGLFLCTPAIFRALEESQRAGDFTLSGGIRILAAAGKAGVMDIGGRHWIDVDDEKALEKAENLLKAGF